MGFCTRRYIFLSICILQMISMIQRQVFDFLGYLWIPILLNFFEIIFIIFGFFGGYQYRPKYIVAYLIWHILWLSWNIFLICLYLNVLSLDHERNIVLKLDPSSDSWWKKEGPGCKVKDVHAVPVEYEGCLVNYAYVEIAQASIQCFFSLLNNVIGICLSRMFLEEDDTFNFEKPDGPHNILLHPMYVSSSDNLHSSNRFINLTSNQYNTSNSNKHSKYHRPVRVDAIREPKRSSSFNMLVTTNRKTSKRPISMCSDNYYDM